jgi:two-component system catabolic regulation response regulator CreB
MTNNIKSDVNRDMKNILLIEDEQSIADTICYALQADSFSVIWKNLGREGITYFQQHPVDLIILDVGLPDMNGFDVCKELRTLTEIPIIFLTARSDEIDRVVGLEIGGDDYVLKPFSPRELVARVKVRLKRSVALPENRAPSSVFDIDENKQRITFDGSALELTRYEYRLLRLLLSQPERIFSREQLMQQVWESPEHAMDRTVDAHIKTLRAKLRNIRPEADLIKTHRGMGYSIDSF